MAKIIIPLIMFALMFYFNSPTHKEKGFKEQARNHLKTLNALPVGETLYDDAETERERVSNQYPIINVEQKLLTVSRSNLDMIEIEKLKKRATWVCNGFFYPAYSQPNEKAFTRSIIAYAKVAQEDGIVFKYTFKDKMGKVIATTEQPIEKCPNFNDALNGVGPM